MEFRACCDNVLDDFVDAAEELRRDVELFAGLGREPDADPGVRISGRVSA
jgi:hypothetical protein